MSSTEDRVERVRALVEPVLEPLGLALDDLSIRQAGNRRQVRMTVDVDLDAAGITDDTTPVSPVTLDDVADATKAIDEVLEESDVMGSQPYTLEVGSPGVSRPLTEARHYRRNVGRLVKVALEDGSQVTGRVVRASSDEVELDVPATRGKNKQPAHTETHAYTALRSATVQVEFNRPDAVIDLTGSDDDADDAQDMADMDDADFDADDIDEHEEN